MFLFLDQHTRSVNFGPPVSSAFTVHTVAGSQSIIGKITEGDGATSAIQEFQTLGVGKQAAYNEIWAYFSNTGYKNAALIGPFMTFFAGAKGALDGASVDTEATRGTTLPSLSAAKIKDQDMINVMTKVLDVTLPPPPLPPPGGLPPPPPGGPPPGGLPPPPPLSEEQSSIANEMLGQFLNEGLVDGGVFKPGSAQAKFIAGLNTSQKEKLLTLDLLGGDHLNLERAIKAVIPGSAASQTDTRLTVREGPEGPAAATTTERLTIGRSATTGPDQTAKKKPKTPNAIEMSDSQKEGKGQGMSITDKMLLVACIMMVGLVFGGPVGAMCIIAGVSVIADRQIGAVIGGLTGSICATAGVVTSIGESVCYGVGKACGAQWTQEKDKNMGSIWERPGRWFAKSYEFVSTGLSIPSTGDHMPGMKMSNGTYINPNATPEELNAALDHVRDGLHSLPADAHAPDAHAPRRMTTPVVQDSAQVSGGVDPIVFSRATAALAGAGSVTSSRGDGTVRTISPPAKIPGLQVADPGPRGGGRA